MGCYESFSADVECICGAKWRENDIQSKDFTCIMDHINQGENVNQTKEYGFLYDDNIFGNLTLMEAIMILWMEPKKYWLKYWNIDGTINQYVRLDENLGERKTAFAGIHEMDFNCYCSCKFCGAWLELIGMIRNYTFIGVKLDKAEEVIQS